MRGSHLVMFDRHRWSYLLRDLFLTPQSAPLTSPRTCEPGPGTLTVTDTENKLSISGGSLVCAGGKAVPIWNDPAFQSASEFSEQAGRTLLCDIDLSSISGLFVGWSNSGALADDGIWFSTSQATYIAGVNLEVAPVGIGPARLAIVRRQTNGTFYLVNGKLEWVKDTNAAARYVRLSNNNCAFTVSNFRVLDLPAWSSDDKVYTSKLTNPSAGATATMTPDALVEWNVTPDTSVVEQLSIRRVDDNNSVALYNAGEVLYLRTIVGGVGTTIGSASGFTNGVAHRVVVVADGNVYKIYIDNALGGTATDIGNNLLAATGVKLDYLQGTSVCASIISWPRYPAFPAVP